MGLRSGLAVWRQHRRKLAGFAGVLALLGPAPGHDGFDLSYPLIRVIFDSPAFALMDMSASSIALVVGLWCIAGLGYFAMVFVPLTMLVILLASLFGSGPPSKGGR